MFQPPTELLSDIQLPDRSKMKTVGDMIRVILADEEVIKLKNSDMKALRDYVSTLQRIGESDAE